MAGAIHESRLISDRGKILDPVNIPQIGVAHVPINKVSPAEMGKDLEGRPLRLRCRSKHTTARDECQTTSCKDVIWHRCLDLDLVWFGSMAISTIIGYLMLNPLYANLVNMYDGYVGFYGISTMVCYLMPNPVYTYYTYILNIKDLVWFVSMAYQPL